MTEYLSEQKNINVIGDHRNNYKNKDKIMNPSTNFRIKKNGEAVNGNGRNTLDIFQQNMGVVKCNNGKDDGANEYISINSN